MATWDACVGSMDFGEVGLNPVAPDGVGPVAPKEA